MVIKDVVDKLYGYLFNLPQSKRQRLLLDIFGWDGEDAYQTIESERSIKNKKDSGE